METSRISVIRLSKIKGLAMKQGHGCVKSDQWRLVMPKKGIQHSVEGNFVLFLK